MKSNLLFAIALVVILIVFIFMVNSNGIMKGLFSDVYGIPGQIGAEMFASHNAKDKTHSNASDFVPAYEEDELDNTYDERGSGPSPADNFESPNGLSPYDGLDLNKDTSAASRVMGDQTAAKHRPAVLSKKPLLVLLGSGAPPAHEMRPAEPDPYQTLPVDGQPGSAKSMFIFSRNPMSTACCPSQYTSDMGCVCLTEEQKKMMQGRADNRYAPSEY